MSRKNWYWLGLASCWGTGVLLTGLSPARSFKEAQLQYPRVKAAYREKEAIVQRSFSAKSFSLGKTQLFMRVFKQEGSLEVWGKKPDQTRYALIQSCIVCASSGKLGPKRRSGDLQVPEGFYYIDRFNPQSNFYLSLGINYPNTSDGYRAGKADPGGDIFIHGNCVTIGCLPMTDDKIKELYIMAVEARNAGQVRIPVHIFPARLDQAGWQQLQKSYGENADLLQFWQNLKTGYDWFEQKKQLPRVQTGSRGEYLFK